MTARSAQHSGTSPRAIACALALLFASSTPALAQRNDSEAWEYVASGVGITAATALDAFATERLALDSTFATTRLGRSADLMGRTNTWVALTAAGYVAGRVAGSDELSDASWHSAVALGVVELVQKGIKIVVGRARPAVAESPYSFSPVSTDWAHQAFPSGHSTIAFAMAAAIIEETDDPAITSAAYAGASVIAWSRLAGREHWASDVVAGGILGTVLTQGVMRTLHSRERDSTSESRSAPPVMLGVRIPI